MKKHKTSATCLPYPAPWRRVSAATLVLCLLAGAVPARAQDPARNEAVLNFVGADIESVVKAIGHYTNTTYIIDPRVKGTVNLVSEKPVTKAQAFELLTSALRLQGYAVVASGPYTKVVPEADAKLQAGPIQSSAVRGAQVRGDQIATQVFHLNYESAVNMVPVLRPLISPNNTINANPGTNSLVITDYADNLRRLGRIIASLDAPASADLDVVPIRYAIATDIATMANRLLESGTTGPAPGAGGGADAGRTGLLADSRTNSVIIRAPSEARARLARSLIDKLDQPTAMPGNVHVIYLKNAEATKLAQTLRAVVASDPSASGLQTGTGGTASTPTNPATNPGGGPGLSGGKSQTGLGQGGLGQGGQLSQSQTQGPLPTGGPGGFIQADPATNSLIITASEAVYRNLRNVVDQLDARRAQVYVESLIVEVSAKRAAEFGIQWAGLSGDSTSAFRVGSITGFSSGGNNLITQAAARLGAAASGTTTTTGLAPPGNGINLGIFRQIGGQLTLGAIARALETDSDANILSMPNLITLDNEEAKIIVGQNVPFVTGQYTTAASGGAAGVNPFQTVERKDIGLSLQIKPQVSEGGTVKMAIYQETSAIQDQSNPSGIITTKRAINTNVLVDNGEIIVLGGLIEDKGNRTVEKVPLLGDIPVVGNLFKYQSPSTEKTNLMVFLRPTIVRNAEQNMNVATDRYEYIRGQQIQNRPEQSWILPNTGSPTLPPLENGRMVGGDLLNLPPGTNAIPPRNPAQPNTPQPAMPQQNMPQPGMPQPGVQEQPPAPPQPAAPPRPAPPEYSQ
jgi:general secretion pathway protein D